MPKIINYTGSLDDFQFGINSPLHGFNIQYPFTSNSDAIDNTTNTIANIKSNILSLLHTDKGERKMNPAFGVGLKQYIFEQMTNELKNKVINEIKHEVSKFFPNVTIHNANVSQDENNLLLSFSFTVDGLEGDKIETKI
jgi:phage baseplate assembly protein W